MFKGHPKGLYVASLANMGERFGFYTMYAIMVLYIQAKFGFDPKTTGWIWGGFLFAVYFLPLIGGIVADRLLGYDRTVFLGIIIMFIGYILLFIPGTGLAAILFALFVIALGTGFFKGNLQAIVGNLYDDPKYSPLRDSAFNIFYMCINIGAFFAPSAARAMNNWILGKVGFTYNQEIPALAHKFLNGDLGVSEKLSQLATAQGAGNMDLAAFCNKYIASLSESYNYGFGVAAISIIVSLLIYIGFKRHISHAGGSVKVPSKNVAADTNQTLLTAEQVKNRIIALLLVFFVVIFFWMSFHQNGLTMTFFARDYTASKVSSFTYIFFNLNSFLPLILAAIGLLILLSKSDKIFKIIGAAMLIGGPIVSYFVYKGFPSENGILPQDFQQFNPLFIVLLTPVVIAIFAALRKKGKEPSAPKKIGIGMIITAIAFMVLFFVSVGLKSPKELDNQVSDVLVSPYWLIGTYLILTIAELFLSPMGISFVSKVAPPQYKGLMQGGWLAATSIGNLLVGVMGFFWAFVPLYAFWAILIVCCLLSATFIFTILKRLERATK
ncbi:MAG: peptide MFS transporter [Bacteroidales bacterium]|nr:peptide MFS transporter [Bacteroidales bacterium]